MNTYPFRPNPMSVSRSLFAAAITILFVLQSVAPFSVHAAADTQLPSAPTGLTASNITYTSISLIWATAHDNTGVKGYQVYRDGKKLLSTSKTSYTNSDLIPGKKYTYIIKAYDAAGNLSADSTTLTAVTASDTQSPTQPSGLSVLSQSHTQVTISWNPSKDNTSIKGYEVYCSEKKTISTASTYCTIKGLLPGKNYSVSVRAYDIAGNYSAQSNTFTVTTTVDNTAPTVPSGLKASSVEGTEITLFWSPSSDDVKVKSYEIFAGGVKLKTASRTSVSITKLVPGTSYTYSVRAVDSSGNLSALSTPLRVSTTADTQAPSAPTALKVKSATKSSASLSWTASTDNIKVKGYRIYWNGLQIAETTRTQYTVKSPLRLGIDIFYVKAYDLSGNLSPSSNKAVALSLN